MTRVWIGLAALVLQAGCGADGAPIKPEKAGLSQSAPEAAQPQPAQEQQAPLQAAPAAEDAVQDPALTDPEIIAPAS